MLNASIYFFDNSKKVYVKQWIVLMLSLRTNRYRLHRKDLHNQSSCSEKIERIY